MCRLTLWRLLAQGNNMKQFIVAFFQHMPPYSGAAALRGHSIMNSLPKLLPESKIVVYSTTQNSNLINGVNVVTLQVPEVENALGLTRRLIGEVRIGCAAGRKMFFGRHRPNVAIISSPAYISALVQTFLAQCRGIPYVLEMRDIYPQVYVEASLIKKDSIIYKLFRLLSRRMYKGASLVLCATKGLAREVLREEPLSNVKCVYNGFPAQLSFRKAGKRQRFTVCFHGVLGFFQDIDTLLQLAERLEPHDIDVLVIGYGRKESPLQNSKLNNLLFLGRQSFERTIEEVERCHLGLCLRLNDNISKDAFPVKVWEYLGLGIPCIITPPCEAGDLIEKHNCGVVFNTGDVEKILTVILRGKNDPTYLAQLSENCKHLAHSHTREQTGMAAAQAIVDVIS